MWRVVREESVKSDVAQDADGFSDEEESEVSFEEGTYDGRHGDVSYHCDADKTIQIQQSLGNARSQEE